MTVNIITSLKTSIELTFYGKARLFQAVKMSWLFSYVSV